MKTERGGLQSEDSHVQEVKTQKSTAKIGRAPCENIKNQYRKRVVGERQTGNTRLYETTGQSWPAKLIFVSNRGYQITGWRH